MFEEYGMTVIVNSEHYVSMLQNFLPPRMEEIVEERLVVPTGWSYSSHRLNSLDVLTESFPGSLVCEG